MSDGIRAEVCLPTVPDHPMASLTVDGPAIRSVTRSLPSADAEEAIFEFVFDTHAVDTSNDRLQRVFEYGEKTAVRVRESDLESSPHTIVERHGSPIIETQARAGSLYLTFHALDLPTLRSILDDIREQYPDMQVIRLLQSSGQPQETDVIYIDRSELTTRQREVLQTAYDRGYFSHPKGANASEIAAELGIDRSTFAEHLAAAQRKLLGSVVE